MDDWKVTKRFLFWRWTVCIKGVELETWIAWLVQQGVPREQATSFVAMILAEVKRVIERL